MRSFVPSAAPRATSTATLRTRRGRSGVVAALASRGRGGVGRRGVAVHVALESKRLDTGFSCKRRGWNQAPCAATDPLTSTCIAPPGYDCDGGERRRRRWRYWRRRLASRPRRCRLCAPPRPATRGSRPVTCREMGREGARVRPPRAGRARPIPANLYGRRGGVMCVRGGRGVGGVGGGGEVAMGRVSGGDVCLVS